MWQQKLSVHEPAEFFPFVQGNGEKVIFWWIAQYPQKKYFFWIPEPPFPSYNGSKTRGSLSVVQKLTEPGVNIVESMFLQFQNEKTKIGGYQCLFDTAIVSQIFLKRGSTSTGRYSALKIPHPPLPYIFWTLDMRIHQVPPRMYNLLKKIDQIAIPRRGIHEPFLGYFRRFLSSGAQITKWNQRPFLYHSMTTLTFGDISDGSGTISWSPHIPVLVALSDSRGGLSLQMIAISHGGGGWWMEIR